MYLLLWLTLFSYRVTVAEFSLCGQNCCYTVSLPKLSSQSLVLTFLPIIPLGLGAGEGLSGIIRLCVLHNPYWLINSSQLTSLIPLCGVPAVYCQDRGIHGYPGS